ncbi:hypothetical protein L207DRAFT_516362 [Hyaloscypha variabilis F]|uniref:Uncharacterized protein n=1 Tax=Hyaloscypha variabilis (strain UAMH 11265 / GT02V1 / F) TaxID=1149755 RepID=A0A2J6RA90_HYAVF|nr:hypothetical protein L207DRAFT_516362 [Hyaloscypha variabilis F]
MEARTRGLGNKGGLRHKTCATHCNEKSENKQHQQSPLLAAHQKRFQELPVVHKHEEGQARQEHVLLWARKT